MRRNIILFILFTLISVNSTAQKQQVWMLGPMLHFNFSDSKIHTSFGIELAYWNYDHFPYSVDGGFEFEKHKIRFYSEAQTGIGILGVSMGPVVELRFDEGNIKAGLQGSVWGNYFAGVDLRFRKVGGSSCFSPGIYAKLPFGYGESDGDGDHHHVDWGD